MLQKFSIISLLIASPCIFAQAPQSAPPDSSRAPQYELRSVLVTATRETRPIARVPYAISMLAQNDMQRGQAGLSLEEALRTVPGVVVNNRYNLSQGDRVSMRGLGSRSAFGVRGIKIILDGIPLTMPDGQSQLNNLDLSSIGRIEVLRGPSSALYGNAAGGLINLQTQPAANRPLRVQPQFLTGSNGLRKWQTKLSGTIGKHNYFVNVSKLDLDGFREHSAANYASINAIGHHEITQRLKLTTVFNYYDAPYLLNPSSLSQAELTASPTATRFFVKQQASGKKLRQGQTGATLKYGDALEVTLYGLSRELFNPIPGRIVELDRTSGGMRSAFGKRLAFGKIDVRWLLGADYEVQNDARREFVNVGIPQEQIRTVVANKLFALLQYGAKLIDQREKVFGLGPFTELELTLRSSWIVTLGGRYDRYKFEAKDHLFEDGVDASGSRVMEQFSPMLGITYRPNDALSVYANYATAFQTPTTTELSNQPTREGGFNPDLQPEWLRSFEWGIKGMWPQEHFECNVALFAMPIEQMLIPYPIQNVNSDEIFFRNAGAARNRGVELNCQWQPARELQLALAYTLMNFEFTDFEVETANTHMQLTDNVVPGVPPQHVFASLLYEYTSGFYGTLEAQWTDAYFTNDFNGPGLGDSSPRSDFMNHAYFTVDLRLGVIHAFKNLGIDFYFGLNNLFGERYNGSIVPNAPNDRFFEPAPGRRWYMGGSVTLP